MNRNYNVIIIDNFSNSSQDVIKHLNDLKTTDAELIVYNLDIRSDLDFIFGLYNIIAVIHLSALKSIPDSLSRPLEYYSVNYLGAVNIIHLTIKYDIKKFIFSSSATVYSGICPINGYTEDMRMDSEDAIHMYGKTKVLVEEYMEEMANKYEDMSFISLRYFNPIGNHRSGLLGEHILHGYTTNILPILGKAYLCLLSHVDIFGSDYNTKDGSCARDYINVEDLAEGHSHMLKDIENGFHAFNLGTTEYVTVLELLNIFNKVLTEDNKFLIKYTITDRRTGDLPICYANCDKILQKTKWRCKYSIEESCRYFIKRCEILAGI